MRPALFLLLCCAHAAAQPAFEVATIKPAPRADMQLRWGGLVPAPMRGGPGTSSPGGIAFSNASLKTVLTAAFGVKRYQIAGPAWLENVGFSIVAKIPAGATKEQVRAMLVSLLVERFRLAYHRENRDIPVYALTVAKNGPKLSVAHGDPNDGGGSIGGWKGNVRWQATNQTASGIAATLTLYLDRPVIDQTGLTGRYEFTLIWTPEHPDIGPARSDAEPSEPAEPAPTVFTAVQELGLKLDARESPYEMIVIDRVEKTPLEN